MDKVEFAAMVDDTLTMGAACPTLDDYTHALAVIHAREAAVKKPASVSSPLRGVMFTGTVRLNPQRLMGPVPRRTYVSSVTTGQVSEELESGRIDVIACNSSVVW